MIKLILISILVSVLVLSAFSASAFEINSPDENWYNSRTVEFSLSDDGASSFYYINGMSSRNPWILLCKNTEECVRSITLKEGINSLSIKAVDSSGNSEVKEQEVKIDSRSPRISKISPLGGFESKGSMVFEIQFLEENLKSVKLNYGDNLEGFSDDDLNIEEDCEKTGNKYSCSIEEDLSEYDGKEAGYWFEVEDEAGNIAKSRLTYFSVDATAPEVGFFKKEISGRTINFIFEVNEANFKNIAYSDLADKNPRNRILCAKLREGRCTASLMLKQGSHKIEFSVQDRAGNIAGSNEFFTNPLEFEI